MFDSSIITQQLSWSKNKTWEKSVNGKHPTTVIAPERGYMVTLLFTLDAYVSSKTKEEQIASIFESPTKTFSS